MLLVFVASMLINPTYLLYNVIRCAGFYLDSPPVPGPYPEVGRCKAIECGRVIKCESSRRPTLKAGGLVNDPAGTCLCMRGILPRTLRVLDFGLPRVTVPPGSLRGRLGYGIITRG